MRHVTPLHPTFFSPRTCDLTFHAHPARRSYRHQRPTTIQPVDPPVPGCGPLKFHREYVFADRTLLPSPPFPLLTAPPLSPSLAIT